MNLIDREDLATQLGIIFPRPPGRSPNCGTCGRFLVWDSHNGGFRCRSIFYDSYSGEWEHD